MRAKEEILKELVELTRYLGDPQKNYVTEGEGNTSARINSETFWVKSSGSIFSSIDRDDFCEINAKIILSDLEFREMTDEEIKNALQNAKINPEQPGRPSIETYLHALVYSLTDNSFVGHTHPTIVNAVLCSKKAEEAIKGRLFPDEIVYCGPEPAYVPYTDPGLPLAKAVEKSINTYVEKWKVTPKVILIQNHGMIALGESADDVKRITGMYVKTIQVLLGTYMMGGPNYLKPEDVSRIYSRPDEKYRQTK